MHVLRSCDRTVYRTVYRTVLTMVPVVVVSGFQQPTPTPRDWRARFATSARLLRFERARAPEREERVPLRAYPSDVPRMTISALPQSACSVRPRGTVIARITSAGAYPQLGIAPGVNYVWVDNVAGRTRQLIIPADTTYPVRWLRVVPHQHKPPTTAARLVIYDARSDRSGASADTGPAGAQAHALAVQYAVGLCTCQCEAPWCTAKGTLLTSEPAPVPALLRGASGTR